MHKTLNLTAAEVSINSLPAGAAVPFVHRHRENEEIYGVLEGSGEIWVDGNVTVITEGDWFMVAPEENRAVRAGGDGLRFVCIQAKKGALQGFAITDGVEDNALKAPWH